MRRLIVLSVLFLFFSTVIPGPLSVKQAEAASTVKIAKTNYKTTDNLNMRTGAGTKYRLVMTIPKGKMVAATYKKGSWYKASYSFKSKGKMITKTGWLSGQYLKKAGAVSKQPAGNSVRFTKTTYRTTDNLRLRSGAGTKYRTSVTIPKGKTITSTEKKGNWYKVSYTYSKSGKKYTKTGWVDGRYIKEYYRYLKTSGSYLFTKKKTAIYPTADKKKKPVYNIGANNGFYSTQKVVNSIGQTWYRVPFKGKNYFLFAGDAVLESGKTFKGKTYQATKSTTLYESVGTSYSKLKSIPKDTVISTANSIGKWYKTTYQRKTGYVYINDFKQINGTRNDSEDKPRPIAFKETVVSGKTFLVRSNLNIRKVPDTKAAISGTIPGNKLVVPTHKTSNGWYKVKYSNKTGYVSGSFLQEVITGQPSNRTGYQFIDLRTKAPVTAAHINAYIANYVKRTGKASILTGTGQTFINAGNKYGVNALYLTAHAVHESGYGTSNISLGKYNLFGFGAYDAAPFIGAFRFSSVKQSIEYIAQEMKATYLNPGSWKYQGAYLGFSTKTKSGERVNSHSEGMNFYYASDPNWGKAIASHMEKILPYNKNHYRNSKPNLKVYSVPPRPAGKDSFPANIQAKAVQDLALTTKKGSNKIDKTLKKGSSFLLIEKHNDFWIKVKVGSKSYWAGVKKGKTVSIISFDRYKEFLTVKNLGRVNTSDLNVRAMPKITAIKVGKPLKLNQYVQLKLDKKGKPVMDNSRKWYLLKLANGKEGWVSSQYITQELK